MDRQYKHFNGEERGVIFAEHRRGASLRVIGSLLGRHASTISRELRGEHPKAWGNCVLLLMLAGIVDAFCTRDFPAKNPPSGYQSNDLASRVGFFVDHLA